ncbi:MAG: tetratricopeptide repeat protein [Bacteroidetes bacterium]|nr:tetratricopeptide repeat protein [Bacteroidota bacterium]
MRPFLLIGLVLINFLISHAQHSLVFIEQDSPAAWAMQAFKQGQKNLSCLLLTSVRGQSTANESSAVSSVALDYYSISCRLSQKESVAVPEALRFLFTTGVPAWRARMHLELAHYFFEEKRWQDALEHFRAGGISHLTNEEIAASQFGQAYALFSLKRYAEALPFFNSIRQLGNSPFQHAALYYTGLLYLSETKWGQAEKCFQPLASHPLYGRLAVFHLGQLLVKKGDLPAAVSYLEENRSLYTDSLYPSIPFKQLLGHAYYVQEDFQRALPLLTSYATLSKGLDRQEQYELSFTQLRVGQLDEAINGFTTLLGVKDSLANYAMFQLAESRLRQGDRVGAKNAFFYSSLNNQHQLLKSLSHFLYGKLSYELGNFDEASRVFELYNKENTSSPYLEESRELLFSSLAASANFRRAMEVLEQVKQPSALVARSLPMVRYGRAVELIYDGELSLARQLLLQALKEQPGKALQPLLHFWLGETCYRQKDFVDAVFQFSKYLSMGGPTAGEASRIHAFYNIGYAYYELNQFKLALPYFEKVSYGSVAGNTSLEQDARLRVADCQYMLKQYKLAKTGYQRIVDLEVAASPYALFQLAAVAGVTNANEKINLLRQLLAKYPTGEYVAEANMALADTYMAEERFIDAIPVLERLLSDATTEAQPVALLKLGVTYYNINENEKALQQFQQLIEKYPSSPEASDALEELKSVYVELGLTTEYATYLKKQGFAVSVQLEDSLQYIAAAQLYDENDFDKAVPAFVKYLEQFPKGGYWAAASFLLGTCYQQQQLWVEALSKFEQIIQNTQGRYLKEAILAAARISFFEQKNYSAAANYYLQFLNTGVTEADRLEAYRGLLRSNYHQKNWSEASRYGDSLVLLKEKTAEDQALQALVAAKFQIEVGKDLVAFQHLQRVFQFNKAGLAAEARYEMAASYYRQQQFRSAEQYAFETINRSGSYAFWVTKAYLLLGDIYTAQKDLFNAKATYQSVLENAVDPQLQKEAEEKLARIENNKSGN